MIKLRGKAAGKGESAKRRVREQCKADLCNLHFQYQEQCTCSNFQQRHWLQARLARCDWYMGRNIVPARRPCTSRPQ